MATLARPLGHASHGHVGAGKPKKIQIDPIAHFLPFPDKGAIAQSGKRCLEGKRFATMGASMDAFEHQAAGMSQSGPGRERRQSGSNQISIDEARASGLFRQKGTRKKRFPRAVRTRNDDDFLRHPGFFPALAQTRAIISRARPRGKRTGRIMPHTLFFLAPRQQQSGFEMIGIRELVEHRCRFNAVGGSQRGDILKQGRGIA